MLSSEGPYLPTHEFRALDRLRNSADLFLTHLQRNKVDLVNAPPSNLAYNYTFNNPKWQPPIPVERNGFPIELGLFNLLKNCTQVDAMITYENSTLEESYAMHAPHFPHLSEEELLDWLSRMGVDQPYLIIDTSAQIERDQILESKIMAPLFDLRLIDWTYTRSAFVGSFFLRGKNGMSEIPHMLSALTLTSMMSARLSTWYINSLRNSLSITDRRRSSGLPFNNPW